MSNKLMGICFGGCVGAARAWRQCVLVAAWAVGFGISAVSHGGLIDDFQSYSTGTVSGGATGGVWTALGNADGANIQDESGNKFLTTGATAVGANVNVYRSIPAIPAANTATTVFMRVRANIATGLNGSFGLADIAPADMNAVGHYEAQFRMINNAGTQAIEARNGGAFASLVSPITVGQWYNIWMVVNNSTDKWDAYVNTGTANATAGDLKLGNIGFRNGAAANDLSFVSLFGGAGGVLGDSVDSIYISSGVDLSNPLAIPEPTTGVLTLLGLCIVMLKRRARTANACCA